MYKLPNHEFVNNIRFLLKPQASTREISVKNKNIILTA